MNNPYREETNRSITTLATIFIVLKLTNNIDWSWWWVLSPFWILILFRITINLGINLFLIYDRKKSRKNKMSNNENNI